MLPRLCAQSSRNEALHRLITTQHPVHAGPQVRHVSSSPYGRTHVWKHRPPKLPNPVVPTFPQRVTLSDGSTFTHYTTSPRSSIKLTRDLTNNPLWNYGLSKGGKFEDEEGSSGRMGRFRRKFEEFSEDLDWVAEENVEGSEMFKEAGGSDKAKQQ